VIRYGFHGLSYEYIADKLQADGQHGHFLVAHLGSGCSAANVTVLPTDTYSNDTSMGFSALDGLPMGTRPGRLDAGVVQHLIGHFRLTKKKLSHLLYKECGLKALCGTNDMRVALQRAKEGDESAAEAITHFVYSVAKELVGLAVCTDGVRGIVFTGGIGENSPEIRAMIHDGLKCLGSPELFVIPTNEELMIARHTTRLWMEENNAAV
jgi:acetate kinase